MDIYRATREAESGLEFVISALKVIHEEGLVDESKERDKDILENVIRRLILHKEILHRFKYEEEEAWNTNR